MPLFSKISKERLSTCDERLQDLFNEVIKEYDCSIVCGHRNEKEQNEACDNKFSKLRFPYSKHNSLPSMAADVVPYFKDKPHIRWDNEAEFYNFSKIVFSIAKRMKINVRWGGNWKRFIDLPHWEI